MLSLFASLLIGCSPTPDSIKFDNAGTVTVHKLEAQPVAKAEVLDKEKKKIDPQPTLTWTVTPDSVAKLEAGKVVPVANGEAKVEAKVGEVKNAYSFKVALPDAVEVAGYTAGTPVAVGSTVNLTATVMAGKDKVDGEMVTWSSSNAATATVDDKGVVTGVAEGTATITATSGALTKPVDVMVGAAPATAAADGTAPAAPATK